MRLLLSSCCCLSLKTGTLIIGSIFLVLFTIPFILTIRETIARIPSAEQIFGDYVNPEDYNESNQREVFMTVIRILAIGGIIFFQVL